MSKQYVRNPDGSLELTRPKAENSVHPVSIPQTAVDLLTQEHAKHPDSPICSPSPLTVEMYLSDLVVNLHRKILRDAGLGHLRFHHLRHTFTTTALQKGDGRENGVFHAGPLRRRLHPAHLHPRHPAETGRGCPNHGQLYGADHVRQREKSRTGRQIFPSGDFTQTRAQRSGSRLETEAQ